MFNGLIKVRVLGDVASSGSIILYYLWPIKNSLKIIASSGGTISCRMYLYIFNEDQSPLHLPPLPIIRVFSERAQNVGLTFSFP